jgi:nicotinamide-nucleotide amidase
MDDLHTIAERVAQKLVARRQTIAISESSAGGLVSAALLAVPGASAYFLGGGIIYTARAGAALINITRDELAVVGMRSSSEPYAILTATRVRELLRADWGLSETGAAGPGGNRYGDAAGHTCFAVIGEGVSEARTLETGSSDRRANMQAFAIAALSLMETILAR